MSTAQLSPGTVVDGTFTIGAPGRTRAGAWSYAATDPQGQSLVLTRYDPECFPSALVLERSLRELRQLQGLQSDRVAPVVACGKLPEGGIYEVNPPLPSQRLDELVAHGPLAAPEAAAVIEQVGQALLEAQKVGVIHRNLGPRVIYVGAQGVVVAGFTVGEPHGGKSFGPLDTIAPEQVEGKVVDQRTLIYNLAALMHLLLHGAPLFEGEPAAQLAAHRSDDPPEQTHARLQRALGKDPRMRPMMLGPFLTELRTIGGGAARAPAAPSAGGPTAPPVPGTSAGRPGGPSSRGWTMFMKAEEGGDSSAAAGGGGAKAPAAGGGAKPKTRGWTMFMEAEGDAAPASTPEAPKPSTRGWTMFTEDESGAEAPAPAGAEAPPVGDAGGAKPKTRGWTMFMEAEAGGATQDAAPPGAAATGAAAEPGASEAGPPAVGAAAPKPKTRGWTMFMESDESDEAQAAKAAGAAASAPAAESPVQPPVTPPAAAAPDASVVPPAAKGPTPPGVGSGGPKTPPKSRGWTMFMDADNGRSAGASAAEADAEAAVAQAAPAEAVPAADEAGASESAANPAKIPAGKKRGWTVFMDKPLSDASGEELDDVVSAPAAGNSDSTGWTVFTPAVQDAHAPATAAADDSAAASMGQADAAAQADALAQAEAAQAEALVQAEAAQADAPADLEAPAQPEAPVQPEVPTHLETPAQPEASAAAVPTDGAHAAVAPAPASIAPTATPAPAPAPAPAAVAPMTPAADPARSPTVLSPPGQAPAAGPGPMAPHPGSMPGPATGPVSGSLPGGAIAPAETRAVATKPNKSNAGVIVGVGVVIAAIVGVVAWLLTS